MLNVWNESVFTASIFVPSRICHQNRICLKYVTKDLLEKKGFFLFAKIRFPYSRNRYDDGNLSLHAFIYLIIFKSLLTVILVIKIKLSIVFKKTKKLWQSSHCKGCNKIHISSIIISFVNHLVLAIEYTTDHTYIMYEIILWTSDKVYCNDTILMTHSMQNIPTFG